MADKEWYRLSWEMVPTTLVTAEWKRAGIPASEIPEDMWGQYGREGSAGSGILDQAAALAGWAKSGEEYVRAVVLEWQVSLPTWEPVDHPVSAVFLAGSVTVAVLLVAVAVVRAVRAGLAAAGRL